MDPVAVNPSNHNEFFKVQNGYVLSDTESLQKIDWTRLDWEEVKGLLRVGVHEDTQGTACGDWGLDGLTLTSGVESSESGNGGDAETIPIPQVTHVLCSACPVSYNKTRTKQDSDWEPLSRLILEACYEACFYVALENMRRHDGRYGSNKLFLTLVGGGVFGNREEWVLESLEKSLEKFRFSKILNHNANLQVYLVLYGPTTPGIEMWAERRVKMGLGIGECEDVGEFG